MNTFHKLVLQRCNELAMRARGRTGTNPNVGAIVFDEKENKILGEGWHQYFGGPHAEIHAISQVKNSGALAGKRIGVSLEPCNHDGKTPACTTEIIHQRLDGVIIDQIDPNPLMSGRSFNLLKSNNIDVPPPLESATGAEVLRPFRIGQHYKRPYIVIKMALSKDGFIGQLAKQQVKISNEMSDRWVHRLRSEFDAILIGTQTAINDNPALTSRYNNTHQPVRLIPDRRGVLSNELRLFHQSGHTIVFTERNRSDYPAEVIQLMPFEISRLFQVVYDKNIGSVLVEGGARVVQSLLDQQLWDEIILIQSESVTIGEGVASPVFPGFMPFRKIKLGTDTIKFINNLKSR